MPGAAAATLGVGIGSTVASGVLGANAADQASDAQIGAINQAIAELREQFGVTEAQLQPFIDPGVAALPGITQGTTAAGLDARLREIFNTDIFGQLQQERQRAVQGQLASSGLSRSGRGLLDAARVPTELGLGLEELLTGRLRNTRDAGFNAALNLEGFRGDVGTTIANLLVGEGSARAGGIREQSNVLTSSLNQGAALPLDVASLVLQSQSQGGDFGKFFV